MDQGDAQWRFVPDTTVPNGHASVDVNVAGIIQNNQEGSQWMMHYAQTPAAQQLAQHLNAAA